MDYFLNIEGDKLQRMQETRQAVLTFAKKDAAVSKGENVVEKIPGTALTDIVKNKN